MQTILTLQVQVLFLDLNIHPTLLYTASTTNLTCFKNIHILSIKVTTYTTYLLTILPHHLLLPQPYYINMLNLSRYTTTLKAFSRKHLE